MSPTLHLLADLVTTPSNLLALCVVLGGVLLLATRRRRGLVLVLAAGFSFLALAVAPVSSWLIMPLEDRFPAPPLPARVDGIVVLGGSISTKLSQARGRPSVTIAPERLFSAAALARRHAGARIILTGGIVFPRSGAVSEASLMRDLLVTLGVPPERLELETEARNTHENAVHSYALAAPKPGETWLLVTSAFHMPRSVGSFRKAGWNIVPFPVDYLTLGYAEWSDDPELSRQLRRLDIAAHEWVGLLGYAALGWTDAVFPRP